MRTARFVGMEGTAMLKDLLIVLALSSAFASAALAEPPPGKGQDKESAPAAPVVVDANDKAVGRVMTSFIEGAHVARTDNGVTYPLRVSRDAIDGFLPLRFASNDCNEPAYITMTPSSLASSWTLAAIGRPGIIGPTVYVIPENAVLENLVLQSIWRISIQADGTVIEDCAPDVLLSDVKSAELLTELDFTPPFRVVTLP